MLGRRRARRSLRARTRTNGYSRSQGASDFGYGLMVDLGGGDDTYTTLHNSQGSAGTRGIGWLVDDAGNDHYTALTTLIRTTRLTHPYDQEGSELLRCARFRLGSPRLGFGRRPDRVPLGRHRCALFDFARRRHVLVRGDVSGVGLLLRRRPPLRRERQRLVLRRGTSTGSAARRIRPSASSSTCKAPTTTSTSAAASRPTAAARALGSVTT